MGRLRLVLPVFFAALVACRHGGDAPRDAGTEPGSTASSPTAAADGRLVSATSHAVIAGVLSWKDPGLPPFKPAGRKDRELAEALVKRASVPPSEVALLIDEAATRAGITGAIDSAARRTKPGETFLFYYAGHGVRRGDDVTSFASADIDLRRVEATGLSMADIEQALGALPKGARALLLADSCFSGSLTTVAEALSKRGVVAAALTSAEASNTSTVNWTFTETLLDALGGEPLADTNGDGVITLAEVSGEERNALEFQDAQRSGFWTNGLQTVPIAAARGPAPRGSGGGFKIGEYVRRKGGARETGRIIAESPAALRLRTLSYATVGEETAAPSEVEAVTFRHWNVGQALRVEWEGEAYDAEVTAVDGDFMRVTYPGWPPSWDEWILEGRVLGERSGRTKKSPAFALGDKVEVKWHGKLWPATVAKVQLPRYLVHYDRYGASDDEWVGPSRIQARKRP